MKSLRERLAEADVYEKKKRVPLLRDDDPFPEEEGAPLSLLRRALMSTNAELI